MTGDGSSVRIPAGELIFAEGDPPTTAFLVESGEVEIVTERDGAKRVLGIIETGGLLGEMAVIDDSPRLATARARTDCVLRPIKHSQLVQRLADADPVVSLLLLSLLARYRSALTSLVGRGASTAAADPGEPAADHGALEKLRLEIDLRAALDTDQLEVWLQPIQSLQTGAIAGYEALVRWSHPQRGAVSPAEFIRLAEETSLINPVGDYVLRRTCDLLVELRRRGREPLPFIALNVSARQLDDPTLVERMLAELHARDLPPACLKVEITESLVLDQVRIGALIDHCHAAGMQVALDDFGTGYSNLGPLLSLDFDQIKLDQRFVRALAKPRTRAIVEAIAAMTRALGSDLLAEGVETEDERDALHALGCRYAQGWLIGRPVAPADVLAV